MTASDAARNLKNEKMIPHCAGSDAGALSNNTRGIGSVYVSKVDWLRK
jgi:hypothetical protein